MSAIFKYPITPGMGFVDLPAGAQMLHVGVQGLQPMLWALVDPSRAREPRRIFIVGTGIDFVRDGSRYVGTFTIPYGEGPFVGHVFEPNPDYSDAA